ncbi:MerR family DNA-binding transcriptional regulator [Priestia megaterium]|nr:MerR family DNA-binding transcriptional regulator [Priestia megaterium]
MNYKNMKALSISAVSQLTGLTLRQIRYYEERQLISPERTIGGTRQYSFSDVELLIYLSSKKKCSIPYPSCNSSSLTQVHRQMIIGQLNAHFKKTDWP